MAICILAMLLREKRVYTIPLPDTLTDALHSLDLQNEDFDALPHLHRIFLGLWMVKWTVTVSNPVPDPTIRALALLSVNSDGGLAEADKVTGWIAKLENSIRLTSLFEIKDLSIHRFGGDDELACQQVEPWFVEKVYSTFASLRLLQHRASAISFGMTSMPKVWWLNRDDWSSMLYRGHQITIEHMRSVAKNLEDAIVRVWEEEVLCGLDLYVSYDLISDDLTNTDVQYSFIADPRNEAFQPRDHLLTAILNDDRQRLRFTTPNAEGDGYRFNRPALHGWLRGYARFQRLRLARSEMLSGGPSRATELASMNYCNTETRPVRNCLALGHHLAAMRLYSKVGGAIGNDRRIPHSLDAVTKDLTIQDLAVARPFAEVAVHLCHPGREDIKMLYREELFVNGDREFNVKDLTNCMEEFTKPVIGLGLGVRSFRHIQIAFERKRCGGMSQLIEDEENETLGALLAGHNRRTHNRVYGLSADALVGPAEDTMPFYLDASIDNQIDWHVVPGGLALSYKDARAHHFDALVIKGLIKPPAMLKGPNLDLVVSKLATQLKPMLMEALKPLLQETLSELINKLVGMY